MLEIKNLTVKIEDKTILNNISLNFQRGEIHAIMGRNGSGKSSLAKVIAGHPSYEVLEGSILFTDSDGKQINLLDLPIEERLWRGIFINFQYPTEIPGLINHSFLRTAYNSLMQFRGKETLDAFDFTTLLNEKIKALAFDEKFLNRGVNVGFSGGEKKRNEILQLSLLDPSIAFLDEVDSGLDIDALNLVIQQVKDLHSADKTFVFITHYAKVISHIKPDYIHIMNQGNLIVSSKDPLLAQEIEQKGFDFLIKEK